jgi:drug/metabolite transporter (DMT)-like permease
LDKKQSFLAGAVWMLVAQALFGVMGVVGRLGSLEVPWQEVVASRFIVGAATAYAVARIRGQSLHITSKGYQWLRTIFGTFAALGTFYLLSSTRIGLGDCTTLFATSAIMIALLSWPLLGERVRKREAFAIAIGFIGVVAVARPNLDSAPGLVGIGLFQAFCTAMAMIWLRKMGPGETSEAIVFHFSCVGAIVAVLLSIPVWHMPDWKGALFLVATGLSGGLAQIAMTRAYSLDSAARVGAFSFSSVVIARLYAFPVFGEIPTFLQLCGSAAIIAAGVLLAMVGGKASKPVAAPEPALTCVSDRN